MSRVTLSENSRAPRVNGVIYVSLKQDEEGIYFEEDVSLSKPDSDLFIKGRVKYAYTRYVQVRYGIEVFASKEKALDLEKELRAGGIAIIKLAKNGKPTLLDIVAN